MFGGFQPNAFQPDTYQNTNVETVVPQSVTGGGGGRSRRLSRQRVILPDETVVEVNAIELEELLKEFVKKPDRTEPRKKKLIRITGADLDRIDLPDFEETEPFRLELPERYVWQPDPRLLQMATQNLARIADEERRIARRRKLKKILLMVN